MSTLILDQLVREFRAVADELDALVIPVLPSRIERAPLTAAVDVPDIMALIRHVRPRVVYLAEDRFSALDYTGSLLVDDDTDDNTLKDPRVRALASEWRSHDGELCRVGFGMMFEGVLHVIVEEEAWMEEFEDAVMAVAEAMKEDGQEQSVNRSAEEKKALRDRVETLVSDPRFGAPKISRAKRTHLASVLFPDLDDRTIYLIVEEAENTAWLAAIS
ncbi:MAG: hypothetical protein ACJ8DU_07760 [Microvirga sp.]|jgi:hypothetical protein|nr:hypothetical protein [Beijerinckiaceae bacterium]